MTEAEQCFSADASDADTDGRSDPMPHFFVLHSRDKVTPFEAATARDALDNYCRWAGIDCHRVVAVSEGDTRVRDIVVVEATEAEARDTSAPIEFTPSKTAPARGMWFFHNASHHPNTTAAERKRMAREFQRENPRPRSRGRGPVDDIAYWESLLALIHSGDVAYIGNGIVQARGWAT